MAKNGGPGGGRRGAIRGRTQFRLPNGHYAKRNRLTGEILAFKADLKPFRNVVREKDNDQYLMAGERHAARTPSPVEEQGERRPQMMSLTLFDGIGIAVAGEAGETGEAGAREAA